MTDTLRDIIEGGGELTPDTVLELLDQLDAARALADVRQSTINRLTADLEAVGAGGVSGRITQRRQR